MRISIDTLNLLYEYDSVAKRVVEYLCREVEFYAVEDVVVNVCKGQLFDVKIESPNHEFSVWFI